MSANATVRTPADLTVIATCPTCEQPTAIRMQIGAELLVTDDGSELRVKGKSKGVAHICDQLPLMDENAFGHRVLDAMVDAVENTTDVVAPLRDLAERMGTDITIEHDGRTATIHGRQVDTETGEILPAYRPLVEDGETLDAALVRLEAREDYAEVIGSPAGQALLELLKDEPGAFVPFLTDAQLAGEQVPA